MTELNGKIIYDSIFEACRHFAPYTILLTLDDDEFRPFRSANVYQLMKMSDCSAVALSNPMVSTLYRGENDVYNHCEASIFRNNKIGVSYDNIAIAIDEIRCVEFEKILTTFPKVQAALASGIKIDFMALAQHYELNTRMIDVSSEPEIAAYFATHRWNKGTMEPIYDGIGCIRGYSTFCYINDILMKRPSKLHLFGMQCFMRPGMQHAYGFETEQGEDLANSGWKVYFKQTKRASDNIHANFHFNEKTGLIENKSWLFPDEEVAEVAAIVKKSTKLSAEAVKEYCDMHKMTFELIVSEMAGRGVLVSNEPAYILSEAKKIELAKQYEGAPYGSAQLYSGLTCKPKRNSDLQ